MEFVNKILVVLLVLTTSFSFGQSTSEKLRNEQKRLERKISDTKLLLKKSQTNTASSLNELKVIENQISYREKLLKNYDNQIRGAELKVEKKELQIESLTTKVSALKEQYKKLLLYAYKHRNKYGQMMYIFSADSYYEAVKRNKYLEKVAEIQKKQFILIKQHQALIKEEISSIESEKALKLAVIDEKKEEKAAIQEDKIKQEEIYKKFKAEESEILAGLKKSQKDKEVLKRRIAAAIQKEIAEAEAKRKAEAAKNPSTASTTTTTTAKTSFAETKESAALSKSFEGNRGKLPWPVEKGTVTEKFGKNAHPTLKNVYTNNRGIDISAPKNAQVRAVFNGEVTSVLNIPGAGKVVIVKHGNYRTVYSNLQESYVKKGDKVKTKSIVGSLLVNGSNISLAHFEIHKVSGAAVNCLNPSLWVAH